MAENPSAFPHDGIDSDNEFSWPSTGMSLRDYFAADGSISMASALHAFGADSLPYNPERRAAFFKFWAGVKFEYADAMLAEREATP